jgi:hypothetical protein
MVGRSDSVRSTICIIRNIRAREMGRMSRVSRGGAETRRRSDSTTKPRRARRRVIPKKGTQPFSRAPTRRTNRKRVASFLGTVRLLRVLRGEIGERPASAAACSLIRRCLRSRQWPEGEKGCGSAIPISARRPETGPPLAGHGGWPRTAGHGGRVRKGQGPCRQHVAPAFARHGASRKSTSGRRGRLGLGARAARRPGPPVGRDLPPSGDARWAGPVERPHRRYPGWVAK